MSAARTARRRRKQAAMGYRHLAKRQRPGGRVPRKVNLKMARKS